MISVNKSLLKLITVVLLIIALITIPFLNLKNAMARVELKKINIVLDPGHGTNYNFHTFRIDDASFAEYQLNYKTALFLKDRLSRYKRLNVYITKNSPEEHPTLKDRVVFAKKIADKTKLPTYLISLHYNVRNDGVADITSKGGEGCMVLAPTGNYNKKVALKSQNLGKSIYNRLVEFGLKPNFEDNDGLWLRESKSGSKYPNGKPTDYYGLIRIGMLKSIPTIIVEHAYMTNINDVRNYLLDDSELDEIAGADALGILDYFHIKE